MFATEPLKPPNKTHNIHRLSRNSPLSLFFFTVELRLLLSECEDSSTTTHTYTHTREKRKKKHVEQVSAHTNSDFYQNVCTERLAIDQAGRD